MNRKQMREYKATVKEQTDAIDVNLKKKDYVLTVYSNGDERFMDKKNPRVNRSYVVCSLEEIPEYIEGMKRGYWTHPYLKKGDVNPEDVPYEEKVMSIYTNIVIEPLSEEMEKDYVGSSKLGFYETWRHMRDRGDS